MPEFTSLAFDAQTQSAPLADLVLHVLAMHDFVASTGGGTAPNDLEATERAVMVLEGYAADGGYIPARIAEAVADVLPLLHLAARYRSDAAENTDMHERRRLRDLAHASESEARRLVRHRITLEGSDL